MSWCLRTRLSSAAPEDLTLRLGAKGWGATPNVMKNALPLIIVCDWIPPAFGAVGQYEMARAEEDAKAGRQVTIIGLGTEFQTEARSVGEGELKIIRLAALRPDKSSLLNRAIWTASKNLSLLKTVASVAKPYGECEIKVTGSPPFLSYQILLWRGLSKKRKITYRVTDFYPETAFAAGKASALRPFLPLIHALRKRADRIEALGNCQKRRLIEGGVPEDEIEVVRDASPIAIGRHVQPARRPFGKNDVVLLYSGNLGVAHDWKTFAEAYRRHVLEGANRVRLWLNATGVGVASLRAYCETNGLPVHVTPPVPLSELAGVLVAADAHLVLLGDAFWGYVLPSKIYGCIESGKPCVYVGPAESDVHTLLSEGGRHFSVRNGDIRGAEAAFANLAAIVDRAL